MCDAERGSGAKAMLADLQAAGQLGAASQEAVACTPQECRLPVEAALAAQQVVVALQRERGTCCWALGSSEGENSFRWQQQNTDERFQGAKVAISQLLREGNEAQESRWGALSRALVEATGELSPLRKRCGESLQHRDETLDSEEDFQDAYAGYCTLIYKVIAAVVGTMPRLRGCNGAPTRLEMRHRLLQYTAEQLGRERAFLTGHLTRPETLRLFGMVMQLAEIIGARKMLLGTASNSQKQGTIVASDTGLLPALKLMDAAPIDPEELAMLESVEHRAMNSRKVDPPAVTEWWCQLTKVIDKIHQHIMVNVVEFFSQSAGYQSEGGTYQSECRYHSEAGGYRSEIPEMPL
uniref:Nitrate/nitrite sensing protein domain-containing protein n=1 Tax=Pyrodinium bahamense TaxID=73915 RepID=A0A7R9ZY83_9DINO